MKKVVYKTRVSLLYTGYGMTGFVFFGSIAYLMSTSPLRVADIANREATEVITWIILGLFVLLSSGCLLMALLVKVIILTGEEIVIRRPLVFYRRVIELTEIERFSEEDYQMKFTHRGNTYHSYEGKQVRLGLNNGKTVKFNSFETGNFYSFSAYLKNALRRAQIRIDAQKLTAMDNSWEGYGWFIFLLLLTLRLVYGVFGK